MSVCHVGPMSVCRVGPMSVFASVSFSAKTGWSYQNLTQIGVRHSSVKLFNTVSGKEKKQKTKNFRSPNFCLIRILAVDSFDSCNFALAFRNTWGGQQEHLDKLLTELNLRLPGLAWPLKPCARLLLSCLIFLNSVSSSFKSSTLTPGVVVYVL